MFGRQPIVKRVINPFQASRGNSAFQTNVPSIGRFPPGALDPASTGLPVPGGRRLLLSHPVTECDQDRGRFSPMLIVPSRIVGLSRGRSGTRCCWLVQLLLRTSLPICWVLYELKCHRSFSGKFFVRGYAPEPHFWFQYLLFQNRFTSLHYASPHVPRWAASFRSLLFSRGLYCGPPGTQCSGCVPSDCCCSGTRRGN